MGRLDGWQDNSQAPLQWLNPEYDNWNRLESVGSNIASFQQAYTYDAVGNLTDRNGLTLTYNPNDRPHLPSQDSQGTAYQYDENGNMAARTLSGGAIISYTYDAENRLTQVMSNTISGTVTTSFVYDDNGQRILRVADNGQERVYLGNHLEGDIRSGVVISGNVINVSNTASDSTVSYLAVNSEDKPYFVWGENDDVWFYRLDDVNFNGPINVSNGGANEVNEKPAIAVGADGTIHMAWIMGESPKYHGEVYYSYSTDGGQSWSSQEDVSSLYIFKEGGTCTHCFDWAKTQPHILISTDNKVHILWHHSDSHGEGGYTSSLLHRYRSANGIWSSIYEFPGEKHGFSGMSVGTNGEIYVMHHRSSFYYYHRWDGNSWVTTDDILPPNPLPSHDMIMTVDDNGTIHLVWKKRRWSNSGLGYQYKLNGTASWSDPELLAELRTSIPHELVSTPEGELHLLTSKYGQQMYYIMHDDTGWTEMEEFPQKLDISYDDGFHIASGIGKPHIIFSNDVAYGADMYRDVFYNRFGLDNIVKRYYTGGQQVATRLVDDSLYYHVNDPTGTSMVMVDTAGEEVGRMLYDGFGGVLTSTMPLTLTGALPDTPDAATGLVHLGGGRWYDPALGRPLQPNPAGGPPTVPQALNRYAATAVGQTGVYQAAASNPFGTALGHQMPGTAMGLAIDLAPASIVAGQQLWGLIEINTLPTRGLAGMVSRFTTSRLGQAFTRLPFGLGKKMAGRYASRYSSSLTEIRLDQGGSLADELLASGGVIHSRYSNTRLLSQRKVPIIKQGPYGELYPLRAVLKTASAAFVIGAGFQAYEDWGNPYLTRDQKIRRMVISGGVSFTSAGIGALVGTAIGGPVGTVVGAGFGFGIGLLAELKLTPRIFERSGDIPKRHLAPLP